MVFGLLAVLGHTFPIFAGFKGGKAVATSAGVLLGFSPILLLILAVYFVASLYLTSMISFSSVTVALLAILSVLLLPLTGWILHSYDPLFTVIVLALATLIILRHKDNIQRIKEKKKISSLGENHITIQNLKHFVFFFYLIKKELKERKQMGSLPPLYSITLLSRVSLFLDKVSLLAGRLLLFWSQIL